MNKFLCSVILASCFCGSVSCMDQDFGSPVPRYFAVGECLDQNGTERPCCVWSDTGAKISLAELEEFTAQKLPTDRDAFTRYYEWYKSSTEDSLIDRMDFFKPMHNAELKIEYYCYEQKDPSVFFEELDSFVELISTCNDTHFKYFLISQFFVSLDVDCLVYYARNYDIPKENLFVDKLVDKFNALIDKADPQHDIIRWRYRAEPFD